MLEEINYEFYKGKPGEHISVSIKNAIQTARDLSYEQNAFKSIFLVFNDQLIKVTSESNPDEILKIFYDELDRNTKEYECSEFYRKYKEEKLKKTVEIQKQVSQLEAEFSEWIHKLGAFRNLRYIEVWKVLKFLIKLIPLIDEPDVTCNKVSLIAFLESCGYKRGSSCNLPTSEYEKNSVVVSWYFGQILDNLYTFGSIHPILKTHGEEILERIK